MYSLNSKIFVMNTLLVHVTCWCPSESKSKCQTYDFSQMYDKHTVTNTYKEQEDMPITPLIVASIVQNALQPHDRLFLNGGL